jgi:hypothetical protein
MTCPASDGAHITLGDELRRVAGSPLLPQQECKQPCSNWCAPGAAVHCSCCTSRAKRKQRHGANMRRPPRHGLATHPDVLAGLVQRREHLVAVAAQLHFAVILRLRVGGPGEEPASTLGRGNIAAWSSCGFAEGHASTHQLGRPRIETAGTKAARAQARQRQPRMLCRTGGRCGLLCAYTHCIT